MIIPLYQIDAFAKTAFEGNPAAVCPLESWLDDDLLQSIASENNLAETAFFVARGADFELRWFTPETEVRLCGHATLASAYVLFSELDHAADSVTFNTLSGPLVVTRLGDVLELDFPARKPVPCGIPEGLEQALGVSVEACLINDDLLAVLSDETELLNLKPDFAALSKLETDGVIVTAKSQKWDFVNRFFAPQIGINEDAVTGSAFTLLAPYWAERLSSNVLRAKQLSTRGGEVNCLFDGRRVKIQGYARLYLRGQIEL